MNARAYDYPSVGCYVDESHGSARDLNERIIDEAEAYGFDSGEDFPEDEESDEYSEALNECADEAVDFLNDLEDRIAMSWIIADNSLFLAVDVESVRGEVGFVSHDDRCKCDECSADDSSYPADGYKGEWLHVSDHGNATLYVRGADGNDTEVWSIV